MKENKLTEKEYWEGYYRSNPVDTQRIQRICSVYDHYWDNLIKFNNRQLKNPETIIEIGGYPGRYLAYLSEKFGLKPTSLDYNSDRQKIDNVMKAFRIEEYQVIQEDFFTYEPTQKYDLVLSNGFVEHFNNYDQVLDMHVRYLAPGGTLLVMIPNMRGYIWYYKTLVDRNNLLIHNLESMRLKNFRSFAARNQLEVITLEYFGGFPYSPHQSLNFPQKVLYKLHKKAFDNYLNSVLAKYPNQYFSGSIIGIFRR